MGTPDKKGDFITKMGRPSKGSLSTFDPGLKDMLLELRGLNEGWGAASLLDDLGQRFPGKELPSVASVNRFLRGAGVTEQRGKKGQFPPSPCAGAEQAHDCWELDAQGATTSAEHGPVSLINIKDQFSSMYVMSFPIPVKNHLSQPKMQHYKWTLRLAFEKVGLPKSIQVDKDSVFYENITKSPFPMPIHLWLVALGVNFCHIVQAPPKKQAKVERMHQTMERQTLHSRGHSNWRELYLFSQQRIEALNNRLGSRSLGNRPPLKVFPHAVRSERNYSIDQEESLLDMERVHAFLAQGKWYRKVSKSKMISLASNRYYLKTATPKEYVSITFDPDQVQFVFHDVNEQILAKLRPVKLSKFDLMGDNSINLLKTRRKVAKSNSFIF